MFKDSYAFSGFSVNDLDVARTFYAETLELDVTESDGMLTLHLVTGGSVLIYAKGPDQVPAEFTVLNFPVDDIDAAADALTSKGINLELYEYAHQDDKGIARGKAANMGPDIAWFKDPSGNILSILHN